MAAFWPTLHEAEDEVDIVSAVYVTAGRCKTASVQMSCPDVKRRWRLYDASWSERNISPLDYTEPPQLT